MVVFCFVLFCFVILWGVLFLGLFVCLGFILVFFFFFGGGGVCFYLWDVLNGRKNIYYNRPPEREQNWITSKS